ncbi:MAG: diaminopimelate epimerase [Pseudonocardia sp.]|nr:diaminopimelate epimerase [Pseudonocardia sp.]
MADPEAGIPFRKGHGTENDFVLLPDPDGALELTPARVRALCDRRRGLGADGVLRVVRTAALAQPPGAPEAEWFMDYRNADGSVAEMCGNGVRVFARYLADAGLVGEDELVVGTRGGPRPVRFGADGEISVAMGAVRLGGTSTATLAQRDPHRSESSQQQSALGAPPASEARTQQRFVGLVVDVGNPHLACVTEVPLDGLDLCAAPGYDPDVFPSGVNIELVTPVSGGEARMRVYERGVGETRSCGTGTVAAAAAALRHDGRTSGTLTVRVPGGRVRVELAEGSATLTGPAVLVAAGEIDPEWWRSLTT